MVIFRVRKINLLPNIFMPLQGNTKLRILNSMLEVLSSIVSTVRLPLSHLASVHASIFRLRKKILG
jgi:hypothetical protein